MFQQVPGSQLLAALTKPIRKTCCSAGIDLFSVEKVNIDSFGRVAIRTGYRMLIPEAHYARIADCSGVAMKKGTLVAAGVIDNDFADEIRVLMVNPTPNKVTFDVGEKIAQVIVTPYNTGHPVVAVLNLNKLITQIPGSCEREPFGSDGGKFMQ